MKSPLTGKPMPLVRQKASLSFRKETFSIYQHYYFCRQSGGQFSTEALENLNQVQLYNKYREKHNIPTSDEIALIRESYGLSLVKMAEVLGLGVNVYRHYELGEVPSLSNARLIQLSRIPDNMVTLMQANGVLKERERRKLMTRIAELKKQQAEGRYLAGQSLLTALPPGVYNGYVVPRQEVVLQLIRQIVLQGPVRINQVPVILFLLDFPHYRKFGKGLSGLFYLVENEILTIHNLMGILHWASSLGICNISFDRQGTGFLLPATSSDAQHEGEQPAISRAISKLIMGLDYQFSEEVPSRIPDDQKGLFQGISSMISYDAAFELGELDEWDVI